MREDSIGLRIAQLRLLKGVSAREMSLSLGQNASYITQIENGKALPSVQGLFYICDYLDITIQQFFDDDNKAPKRLESIIEHLKKLDPDMLAHLDAMIEALANGQGKSCP